MAGGYQRDDRCLIWTGVAGQFEVAVLGLAARGMAATATQFQNRIHGRLERAILPGGRSVRTSSPIEGRATTVKIGATGAEGNQAGDD